MMLFYLDKFRYQIMVDIKAGSLRVIDTNRLVRNGYACSIEPNNRKVITNIDYTNAFK